MKEVRISEDDPGGIHAMQKCIHPFACGPVWKPLGQRFTLADILNPAGAAGSTLAASRTHTKPGTAAPKTSASVPGKRRPASTPSAQGKLLSPNHSVEALG